MNQGHRINIQYIFFLILFYFFITRDCLEQYWPFFGYGDEIIALLAIPAFVIKLRKDQFIVKLYGGGYGKCVAIFIISGLLGSMIFHYQSFLRVTLPDMFLCMKFWLALYVGKNTLSKLAIKMYAKKLYRHVCFVTGIYAILYVVDLVWHVFKAEIRYGVRCTQLMYSHPTTFVACCVFLIGILIALSEHNTGWKKCLGVLLFLTCTTMRGKAWGISIVIVLICYFVFYRRKKITIKTLLLFVPLVVALAWDQIYYYFFSSIQDDSARYQLLIKSFAIMKDHFPIGSGFGTYASYYSGKYYSPLYSAYGLTGVHGLTRRDTSFMSDSFWPMVIGQTGLIGTVAFGCALLRLFREIQKVRITSIAFYASVLSMLSYLLIASTAESAFVHPLAMPIAIWIGVIMNQNKHKSAEEIMDANIARRKLS